MDACALQSGPVLEAIPRLKGPPRFFYLLVASWSDEHPWRLYTRVPSTLLDTISSLVSSRRDRARAARAGT